jgi:hypothetical protein
MWLWARLSLPPALLVMCAFFAVRALLAPGSSPLGRYDEALLLTNAQMMNDGRAIYRDFYSNYPPGIFQLARGVLALGLPGVWTLRLIGVAIKLLSAFGAAWLVGRIRGAGFSWLTAATILLLQSRMGLPPYAYSVALVLVLVIVALWPQPGAARSRRLVCGALFGLLSYVRHDVFVYSVAAILAAEGLSWGLRRRSLFFATRREFSELAATTVGVTLLLWAPIFATAGVSRVVHDIALDVAKLTMPARVLPVPPLFTSVFVSAFDMTLPAFLVERTRLCLALGGVGMVAGVVASLRKLLAGGELRPQDRALILLSALAIATAPQALGRTDHIHVAFGIPLTIGAMFAALGPRVAWVSLLLVLLQWFANPPGLVGRNAAVQLLEKRADVHFMTAERKALTEFVTTETKEGEAIFVGCTSHRRHIANTLDVYYWAHRPGATRYMQFDPGLTTSEGVQTEMIADLERVQPNLVLLYKSCWRNEPNASRIKGSAVLDDYLSEHYVQSAKWKRFLALKRKQPSGATLQLSAP